MGNREKNEEVCTHLGNSARSGYSNFLVYFVVLITLIPNSQLSMVIFLKRMRFFVQGTINFNCSVRYIKLAHLST